MQIDTAVKTLAKGKGPTQVSPAATKQATVLMEVGAQRKDLILRADALLPSRTLIAGWLPNINSLEDRQRAVPGQNWGPTCLL